jgi:citrate lyase subunit alpha/citrate CoA-transferase
MVAPLIRGRIPTVCDQVVTVVTPGEDVDIVVTDYGIAINPRRQDLIEAYKDSNLPFCTIEELRDKAYAIVGTPEQVQFKDKVVGILEARDGSILDVIREVKPFEFKD